MKPNAYGILLIAAILFSTSPAATAAPGSDKTPANTIRLDGHWQFNTGDQMDADSRETILLPGSMPQRLKGNIPDEHTVWTGSVYDSSFFYNPSMAKYRTKDNFKPPFFLAPDRHYVGPAWYSREVSIPKEWKGRRVVLRMERPHIHTDLWVNGKFAGRDSSLCVAHEYDITRLVHSGSNTLSIKVDNRTDRVAVGDNSHSVSDQTQGNWNGIVGRIELVSTAAIWADDIRVYPDIHKRSARVEVELKSLRKSADAVTLTLRAHSFNSPVKHVVEPVTLSLKIRDGRALAVGILEMGDQMQIWDEFSPALYMLETQIESKYGTEFEQLSFGMREFVVDGNRFLVNGRETFLRGTVENCLFPQTGYPPMDTQAWERIFRICRSYGLNHMRFHSWCPPKAAFEAADLVGFYLQPEGPSWPNFNVRLGNGMSIDSFLMEETQRLNKAYGNHASFCMLACGNEPAGNWVPWVSDFVDWWKEHDPRHVYTGASVGGGWQWQPKSMFHVKAGARGLNQWKTSAPQSLDDFCAIIDTVRQPFVSHETGQWCAFPNLDETDKYTGVSKARNFELFRDILEQNDMGDLSQRFYHSSGKLQALCYKYELEKTLRTPGYDGFQLLALNDYSGQGSAIVGLTDVFFDPKEYISAEEFREFCSPVTLLAKIPKFTYNANEAFRAEIQIAQFAKADLRDASISYNICDELGRLYARGTLLKGGDVPLGNSFIAGEVLWSGLPTDQARKYTLRVSLTAVCGADGEQVSSSNHWNFWVYPPQDDAIVPKADIYICKTLDERAEEVLAAGGRVLITADGNISYGEGISQMFTPVFWNTSWFKMRPPHTTGLYVRNMHPALKDFPTDSYSDLQWWSLVNRHQVMLLSEFPAGFQPIVQSIDTWFLSRKIGMLIEARVGEGLLMVTTLPVDEENLSEEYPERAQMRRSILSYMATDAFRPQYSVDIQLIRRLFTEATPTVDLFTKSRPEELKPVQGK